MSSESKTRTFTLKRIAAEAEASFTINKPHMTLGTHPFCDIFFFNTDVSTHHAEFLETNEGLLVKDLSSESGVFVNNKKIIESPLAHGDILGIGANQFLVECEINEINEIDEIDELPPLPDLPFIDESEDETTVEDFKTTVENQIDEPISSVPQLSFEADYVDLDQLDSFFDITQEVNAKRLEVITYLNGLIQDITYIDLRSGSFYLSPRRSSKNEILFSSLPKTKILTFKKGLCKFHAKSSLETSHPWDEVNLSETFIITAGQEQVSFRLVDKAYRYRGIPLFFRDREFLKKSALVFMLLFIPMLMLGLVDIVEQKIEEKKEVAVVYKLPKPVEKETPDLEKSELTAEELTSTEENTGHKETEQPAEKVEFAQASEKVEVVAKATTPEPVKPKATPAPPTPAPPVVQKPVAQVKPVAPKVVTAPKPTPVKPTPVVSSPVVAAPTPAPVVAPPVVAQPVPKPEPVVEAPKPYSFKSAAVGSLVSDTPSLNTNLNAESGGAPDKSFNAGNSMGGELVAGTNIGVSKLNGSDRKGSGSASYGSRGLANKAGFDSAYLEPNTILRGSMDPELLRKILREYIPQFRHCYQKELLLHSEDIKGIMDLNFTIGASGRATKYNVQMKDAKLSPQGVRCMGQVLSHIDFPKPKGGGIVDVKQPMNFSAETRKF
jgi:hypothetical protein